MCFFLSAQSTIIQVPRAQPRKCLMAPEPGLFGSVSARIATMRWRCAPRLAPWAAPSRRFARGLVIFGKIG